MFLVSNKKHFLRIFAGKNFTQMHKQLRLFSLLLLSLLSFGTSAQNVSRLVGASPFQDSLWLVDTTTFTVTHRVAPNPSAGGSITGTNGIARHPATGQLFVVVKQSAVSGRMLGTIDVTTGLVSLIGNLGDNFSSITFNGNNTLLGVTGDGAAVSETAYRISQTDASKTLLRTLGNGADGEVISYNPDDNMIYHWSGNGTIVYEKFDTSGVTVTNIPIIGTTNGETFGSVFIGNNTFLNSNINSGFNKWNANGTVAAQIGGGMPDDFRGLAFYTCVRQLSGTPDYCAGDSTELSVTPAISYQWTLDGVDIPGATSQTYFASAEGEYSVRVQDVCGTALLTNTITVDENPLPNVALAGPTSFCTGDTIILTGSSGGTSQWYMNGAELTGEANDTLLVSAAGIYNMTKTNLNGCTDSSALGITVIENPLPVVDLTVDNAAQCIDGALFTFTPSPAGGNYDHPGVSNDMITGTDAGVGTTTVFYEYTDANGCVSFDSLQITVHPEPDATVVPSATEACVYDGLITLTGNPAGGVFAGSGVTGNSFDPSGTGVDIGNNDIMYVYEDANGCSDTGYVEIAVDSCLFVSELGEMISFEAYPNPAAETIRIVLNQSTGQSMTLSLIDVTGKIVNTAAVKSSETEMSVAGLQNGAYWIRLEHASGVAIRRIVVLH